MLGPMGITTEVWDKSERVTGIMSTFRIGVNAQPGESREIEMWRVQMHNLIADAARWSCVREGCVRTRASSGMAVLSGGQGNIGVAECATATSFSSLDIWPIPSSQSSRRALSNREKNVVDVEDSQTFEKW